MPFTATPPEGPVTLSANARTVLEKRYLVRDENGTPVGFDDATKNLIAWPRSSCVLMLLWKQDRVLKSIRFRSEAFLQKKFRLRFDEIFADKQFAV